jgi:hypothetical protein
MWDSFDRAKAEAEFRSGLVVPFIVLIGIASYEFGVSWILFFVVVPWWLLVLATRKAIETTSILVQAVALGYVQPPLLDRWAEIALKRRTDQTQRTDEYTWPPSSNG